MIFLVVFEHRHWFSLTSFSVSLLSGWSTNWSMYMAVYTCTLCSCEHQRRRRERGKKGSGRSDHNGVGVTFICTQNGLCVGPGPPSLILYQLTPSPHPQTHTNTAEETDSRPPTLFFPLLFTPLLSSSTPFALKIYCIPQAEHFLNYRLEVP